MLFDIIIRNYNIQSQDERAKWLHEEKPFFSEACLSIESLEDIHKNNNFVGKNTHKIFLLRLFFSEHLWDEKYQYPVNSTIYDLQLKYESFVFLPDSLAFPQKWSHEGVDE